MSFVCLVYLVVIASNVAISFSYIYNKTISSTLHTTMLPSNSAVTFSKQENTTEM